MARGQLGAGCRQLELSGVQHRSVSEQGPGRKVGGGGRPHEVRLLIRPHSGAGREGVGTPHVGTCERAAIGFGIGTVNDKGTREWLRGTRRSISSWVTLR